MTSQTKQYDDTSIVTLEALEHIRLRPGMYIGRLGDGTNPDDGIYILLKEIIDNSVDEFTMHNGSRINITIIDNCVSVRDFGRGIPLGKVVECVSKINTGAKYNNDVFKFSVGLNGVGTKAVNALSSFFTVTSFRDGRYKSATFEKGKMTKEDEGETSEANGTYFSFIPDEELFGPYAFDQGFVETRLINYACLNLGLTIDYNKRIFKSKNGLLDILTREVGESSLYRPIYYKSELLEFTFTHTGDSYGETYFSYVNGQHTSDGGTHQSAFKEGLLKGINEFYKKNWSPQDVREGLVGCVAIRIANASFEGQTKNKLSNTDIKADVVAEVKNGVIDFLMKNKDVSDRLSEKVTNNEKLRKDLNEVKKNAKVAMKKTIFNIPKLRDCKHHLGDTGKNADDGERTMIFLTEGDSASGTITKTRDVATQAVFSLRGKILNVQGKRETEIYKNEELFNMTKALGLDGGVESLRYSKVVIATDADNDGFHIRILLITFFLNYFEDLIQAGRVFILETPLFRVRNKAKTLYCYSEAERDRAAVELKGSEITRFKGLGEIDPSEFSQFIGPEIKLIKVDLGVVTEARKAMAFYMGNNSPERRDFILENLR